MDTTLLYGHVSYCLDVSIISLTFLETFQILVCRHILLFSHECSPLDQGTPLDAELYRENTPIL